MSFNQPTELKTEIVNSLPRISHRDMKYCIIENNKVILSSPIIRSYNSENHDNLIKERVDVLLLTDVVFSEAPINMRDSIKDIDPIQCSVINKFIYTDESLFAYMPTYASQEIVDKISSLITFLSLGYNDSAYEMINSIKKLFYNTVAENDKARQMSNTVSSNNKGVKVWPL